MQVYQEMAEYYDLLYGDNVDLEFYLREARNARGGVLEVACGTGRILLRLVKEGIDAAGIDISGAMLSELRKKADRMGIRADARLADMTSFSLGRKFRLIIVPYRSFLHLKDERARRSALGRFMEHLEPGGRLILHTYNPSEEEKRMTEGYHLFETEDMVSPEGKRYSIDWLMRYESGRRVGHYKIILRMEGAGPREFQMDISYVPVREMEELLRSAGFRNIKSYCGFDYMPFDGNCREVLWIAER
jgi:SAM-dependent methyltransferase